MCGRRSLLRERIARALVSLGAVALVSAAVYLLEPFAPVLSLGVLYMFAVLPIAALWGLSYAVPVSIVSMLAFNWLFLPPQHTFRLADPENWVALAVYLVTAVSVSGLATRARRRAVEAVEADALRRSDAAKTAVLRSVSHDLRSPITSIMTATDVLEDAGDELDPLERAELLASIGSQVHRLERLVANLLDLSRLEARAASPVLELWTIDSLVAGALETMRPEDARVRVELPEDSPPVRVDATQLEQVLVNLIDNALKYSSPTDQVVVCAEHGAGEVVIRVVDRGPGIPPSEREAVFEPFSRGGSEGPSRGSGLGLAIARGFVELNGGRLWVDSEPGRGCVFAIALPAMPSAVETRA